MCYQLCCQFDRRYWVDIRGLGLPPVGYELGGISGGPMLQPIFLRSCVAEPQGENISIESLAEAWYGQCWTLNEDTTDAMAHLQPLRGRH
jgi:hypothetical protein